MVKKIRYLFFTTVWFLAMSSCSSSKVLRLYPEPPLPSSETARLHLFAGESRHRSSNKCILRVVVKEFDGKSPGDSHETIEFLSGPHSVTVDFKPHMSGGIQEISFDAQAGGDYIFGCGMNYSLGEWRVEVLDRATGEKVSYGEDITK